MVDFYDFLFFVEHLFDPLNERMRNGNILWSNQTSFYSTILMVRKHDQFYGFFSQELCLVAELWAPFCAPICFCFLEQDGNGRRSFGDFSPKIFFYEWNRRKKIKTIRFYEHKILFKTLLASSRFERVTDDVCDQNVGSVCVHLSMAVAGWT